MPKILLQEEIPFGAKESLEAEFPQFDFVLGCENDYDWHGIEVIYGNQLTESQFSHATRLKWIHCPGVDTSSLCEKKIRERGDILLSIGARYDVRQVAEFVFAGILGFAKQLHRWPHAPHDPEEFWNWPLKETMWTLKDRTLLQVGLGAVGSEIVKLASRFEMKIWGIRRTSSFHPYCKKTFSIRELHSLLPSVDVVVLALPRKGIKEIIFGIDEFKLMKPDSVFIVVGSAETVDEHALAEVAKTKKFRGVLLDAFAHPPPKKDSPLWELPDTLLTPSIAGIPESEDLPSLRLFRRNLRLYIPGKINEMKNLILV